MCQNIGELHLILSNSRILKGKWELKGESLLLEIKTKQYKILSDDNLSENVRKFIKIIGKNILKETVSIKGCMNCNNFQMSNMGREMSRGQRGTCRIHNKSVEICFLCDQFEAKVLPGSEIRQNFQ